MIFYSYETNYIYSIKEEELLNGKINKGNNPTV